MLTHTGADQSEVTAFPACHTLEAVRFSFSAFLRRCRFIWLLVSHACLQLKKESDVFALLLPIRFVLDQCPARAHPIVLERHQGFPIRVEIDVGHGHVDVRQLEVIAGSERELLVDALDRLAQFLKLGRGFLANLFEALGVDLLGDPAPRCSTPPWRRRRADRGCGRCTA